MFEKRQVATACNYPQLPATFGVKTAAFGHGAFACCFYAQHGLKDLMNPKRPLELPERLAVLLLEELTNIHALVQTLADMEIQRLAEKIQIETGISRAEALRKAVDDFEAVREPRAKKFFEKQLNRLNLPCIEKENPPSAD